MNPPAKWVDQLPDYETGQMGYVVFNANILGITNGVEEFVRREGTIYMHAVFIDDKLATFTDDGELVLVENSPAGYSLEARTLAGYGQEVLIEPHVDLPTLTKEEIVAAVRAI